MKTWLGNYAYFFKIVDKEGTVMFSGTVVDKGLCVARKKLSAFKKGPMFRRDDRVEVWCPVEWQKSLRTNHDKGIFRSQDIKTFDR